jgi:hypothetical protein
MFHVEQPESGSAELFSCCYSYKLVVPLVPLSVKESHYFYGASHCSLKSKRWSWENN